MRIPTLCLLLLPLLAGAADLPDYAPAAAMRGSIRTWGSPRMGPLMRRWEKKFRTYQPNVTFVDHLKGDASAQVPLAFRVADLALMDRDLLSAEWYNTYQRRHYYVTALAVATGSPEAADGTYALTVFVNRQNPLAKLTLPQLDGIFGEARSGAWEIRQISWHPERARSASENLRTWGQLGLTGEWADKPIHPYGYPTVAMGAGAGDPGAVQAFRDAALSGSNKWNPDLREFPDGRRMIEALAQDPYGIAFTAAAFAASEVKEVSLSRSLIGPYLQPTPANVADHSYPLTRSVFITFGRPPGYPTEPKVREFLRFVLSRQGQKEVTADGTYLPLTPDEAARELRKVE
jgi:phosphate transport system substrate-binding protein